MRNLNQKFELIRKAIIDDGFNNSALIYSVSETSTTGGKWDGLRKLN